MPLVAPWVTRQRAVYRADKRMCRGLPVFSFSPLTSSRKADKHTQPREQYSMQIDLSNMEAAALLTVRHQMTTIRIE